MIKSLIIGVLMVVGGSGVAGAWAYEGGIEELACSSSPGTGTQDKDFPVPWPFDNRKFELADGEEYRLYGKVVYLGGHPHLQVDLKRQPWLANKRRAGYPYYSLADGSVNWKFYRNLPIDLVAEARVVIDPKNRNRNLVKVILDPVESPSIIADSFCFE